MVLNDLPVEISTLFIVNEKMTSNKAEILDFCDSIVDFADGMLEEEKISSRSHEVCDASSNQNRMERFDFDPNEQSSSNSMEVDEQQSNQSKNVNKRVARGGVAKRGRGKKLNPSTLQSFDFDPNNQLESNSTAVNKRVARGGAAKRGRGKKLNTINEDSESSNYDYLQQMDDSSRSSWSS